MPLYEYQCQTCQHRLEAIQRFSDDPLTVCPDCGGALKKLVSAPAFQFKGSGFYKTDYPSATAGASSSSTSSATAPATAAATATSSSSDTSATSASKTETKSSSSE